MVPGARTAVAEIEEVWIKIGDAADIVHETAEMMSHVMRGGLGIPALDRIQHSLVLDEHALEPSSLGEGQTAVAVDLHLNLLCDAPNSWVACGIRNGSMKVLIALVELVPVFTGGSLAQLIHGGSDSRQFLRSCIGNCHTSAGFFQCTADDDGLRQRMERDAGNVGSRLWVNVNQSLFRQAKDCLPDRCAADPIGFSNLFFHNQLSWEDSQSQDVVAKILSDHG